VIQERLSREEIGEVALVELKTKELQALVALHKAEERRREVEIELSQRKIMAAAAARSGLPPESVGRLAQDKDGPFFIFEQPKGQEQAACPDSPTPSPPTPTST